MSDFLDLIRRMDGTMVTQNPTPDEQAAMAIGNVLAETFIGAVRDGTVPADALVYAAYLVGRSGPEAQACLLGFYRRITEELRA